MVILTWLGVPGDEGAWYALGFNVHDGAVQIGQVRCEFSTQNSWGFDDIHGDVSALSVPTLRRPAVHAAAEHPCRVTQVDHIVYTVTDLDAGVAALNEVLGTQPRRRFFPRGPKGPEMAFYRAGEAFIEVVASGDEPALIGLALKSPDLDSCVETIRSLGSPISDPKPAVQGGRIATVWQGHLGWGLAIMGP